MYVVRFALLLTSASMLFAARENTDHFYWTAHVASGKIVEIKNINGNIRAIPSDGDVLEIMANTKSGVEVKVTTSDRGITACVANACQADFEKPGVNPADRPADFVVHIPAGVRIIARTVNGVVEASRLASDAEAHTVNGNIRLSTTQSARAETKNGSIQAVVGKVSEATKFSTVNGTITLEMPVASDAEVHAQTVNGRIASAFPLSVHGKLANKHAEGRIGHGGPALNLSTVNGSIQLRRLDDCEM